MVGFRNQAAFHPVRYINALAKAAVSKGAKIYCGTKAHELLDGDIKTVLCDEGIEIKQSIL